MNKLPRRFAHAYNFVTGTALDGNHTGTLADPRNAGISNFERQAVGLSVDHDNDISTPKQLVTGHSFNLTENGLRTELDLNLRTEY